MSINIYLLLGQPCKQHNKEFTTNNLHVTCSISILNNEILIILNITVVLHALEFYIVVFYRVAY